MTIGRYLDPLAMGLKKDIFDFDFEAAALMGGGGKSNDDKKSDKVTFRSKVVSRMHAQMWVDETGQVGLFVYSSIGRILNVRGFQFWIKDTKSSSG